MHILAQQDEIVGGNDPTEGHSKVSVCLLAEVFGNNLHVFHLIEKGAQFLDRIQGLCAEEA